MTCALADERLLYVATTTEVGLHVQPQMQLVPINSFQLFHQGNNCSVHIARFVRQFLHGLVIADTGHFVHLFVRGFVETFAPPSSR